MINRYRGVLVSLWAPRIGSAVRGKEGHETTQNQRLNEVKAHGRSAEA